MTEEQSNVFRRCLAGFLFLVFVVGICSSNIFVVIFSVFMLALACFAIGPDMGAFWASLASRIYWGHSSKAAPDYSIAKAAAVRENWSAAITAYESFARADPEDQIVRFELAMLYLRQLKKKELACYWFDQVLAFKRRNEMEIITSLEKIKILCEMGDLEQAKIQYGAMVRMFPLHNCTETAYNVLKDFEDSSAGENPQDSTK